MPGRCLFLATYPHLRRGRERYHIISASVGTRSASATQPQHRPRRDPFQIPCLHRCIGRDHDDHRSVRSVFGGAANLFAQVIAAQFPAYGSACDYEHANRVPAQFGRKAAGGGSDAALEAESHRPGTRADRALLDWPTLCVLDGSEYVLPRDVPSPDIVQVSVVRFANQRVDRFHILVSRQAQHVVDERVPICSAKKCPVRFSWAMPSASWLAPRK